MQMTTILGIATLAIGFIGAIGSLLLLALRLGSSAGRIEESVGEMRKSVSLVPPLVARVENIERVQTLHAEDIKDLIRQSGNHAGRLDFNNGE